MGKIMKLDLGRDRGSIWIEANEVADERSIGPVGGQEIVRSGRDRARRRGDGRRSPRVRTIHDSARSVKFGMKIKGGRHTSQARRSRLHFEASGTIGNAQAMGAHESPRTDETPSAIVARLYMSE
jgi:hypothetical protein